MKQSHLASEENKSETQEIKEEVVTSLNERFESDQYSEEFNADPIEENIDSLDQVAKEADLI